MRKVKKEKYITRTIKTTVCTAVGIDLSTKAMATHFCEMPGHLSAEEALENVRTYFHETGANFATAYVAEVDHKETLYRLPERIFVLCGEPVNSDEETEEE